MGSTVLFQYKARGTEIPIIMVKWSVVSISLLIIRHLYTETAPSIFITCQFLLSYRYFNVVRLFLLNSWHILLFCCCHIEVCIFHYCRIFILYRVICLHFYYLHKSIYVLLYIHLFFIFQTQPLFSVIYIYRLRKQNTRNVFSNASYHMVHNYIILRLPHSFPCMTIKLVRASDERSGIVVMVARDHWTRKSANRVQSYFDWSFVNCCRV